MGYRDPCNCSTSNQSKYVCQCVIAREHQARLGGLGSLVSKWSHRSRLDIYVCLRVRQLEILATRRTRASRPTTGEDCKVWRLTEIPICVSQSLCFSPLFLSTQWETTGDKEI